MKGEVSPVLALTTAGVTLGVLAGGFGKLAGLSALGATGFGLFVGGAVAFFLRAGADRARREPLA